MPELKNDELSALNDAVVPLAAALARGITTSLGIDGAHEPPIVGVDTPDGLVADFESGIQLTFSFPTSLADEAMLAIRSDDFGTLANALGWDLVGSQSPTDEQVALICESLGAAAREMCSAGVSPGEPGGLSHQVGAPQLPPCFAVPENAIRVAVPIQLEGGTVEALLFITAVRARAILAESLIIDGAAAANGNGSRIPISATANAAPYRPADDMPQPDSLPRGMDLLLDIPLDVSVELGRVRMLIKDVLELSPGSVVELDRVAGEPVDLIVNGRLVAKGEVVVVEDNFGIRVTEIVSPADRLSGLGKRG